LRAFFYEGKEKYQWSYSSYCNHHKYLKKFLNWALTSGLITENPILQIKKPKKPAVLPRRLTAEDAQKILYCTLNYKWRYESEYLRNHAIIATFLFTGLRCNELINLKYTDVNLESGNIFVSKGKGAKDRNVPIHPKLKSILNRYIQDRRRSGKLSEYFFTAIQSNKPLRYKNVRVICRKLSKATGVTFTPHCLRHTFGSVAIEQDMGLVQLKEIMGHSDISSTMLYLKMSSKGLKESISKIELF